MKKNVMFFSALAVLLTVILGFSFINKDKIVNSFSSIANYESTNTDNLIVGAKYNPDNINAIWTESFDGVTYPPTGWVQIQELVTATWARYTSGSYPTCAPHSGAGMIGFNSFDYSAGVSSLVSAVFSLTSGPAKLGFWMYRDVGYASATDNVDYMINTVPNSSGATSLGIINRSKSLAPVETGPDGWYYYEFAIPAGFNTATNYIILKATSNYGNNIYVDDVSVSLLPADDVGVLSIDVASTVPVGSMLPKATVKNFGSATQTFPVVMTITGGYSSTKTVTALVSGGTQQVTFDNWNATGGSFTIKVISNLSNDVNRANDTLIKGVTAVYGLQNLGWMTKPPITEGRWADASTFFRKGTYPNDTGFIYVIAGATPAMAISNIVYRYNVKTGVWDVTPPVIPVARYQFSAATMSGKIYVPGGYTGGTTAVNSFDIFDPIANTWSAGPTLPTAAGDYAIGVYNDSLLYVMSGYSGTADVTNIQIYSKNTNTWSAGTPKPGVGCGGIRGGIAGNKIVLVGGYNQVAGRSLDSVYVGTINPADPRTITWGPGSIGAYPGGTVGRHAGGVPIQSANTGLLTNKYVLFTAGDPNGAGTSVLTATWAYDVIANMWLVLPNKTTGVSNVCNFLPVTKGDSIFMAIVGGYNGAAVTAANEWLCLGVGTITGIGNSISEAPTSYTLSQNYPNPFNPSTTISYALPKAGIVTLKIYDILGREVASLVNEFKQAGNYAVNFNASNLSSGIYFYSIKSGDFTAVKKMTLIK